MKYMSNSPKLKFALPSINLALKASQANGMIIIKKEEIRGHQWLWGTRQPSLRRAFGGQIRARGARRRESSRAGGRGLGSRREGGGRGFPGRERGYLIVPRARGESLHGLQAPRRYRSPAGLADFLWHKLSINFLHAESNQARDSQKHRARHSVPPLPAEPWLERTVRGTVAAESQFSSVGSAGTNHQLSSGCPTREALNPGKGVSRSCAVGPAPNLQTI